MLLFSLLSLVIFTIVLTIHYKNHFKLVISDQNLTSKRKCGVKLVPVGAKTFHFYPMSFLMYNIFNILLCFTTVIVAITNAIIKKQNGFVLFLKMNLDHNISNNSINTQIYILIYAIMLLSIWDSLYSFHRYYATHHTTIQYTVSTSTIIFKRYIIFAILFAGLYLIQIHLIYWIFPVIILLNFSFNTYCNAQFKNILIKRCIDSTPIQNSDSTINSENEKFIRKANFLWKTSFICCILQSLSLGLLVGAFKYNQNILYFFPLFWCSSSAIWSMSFIRNREYFQEHICCSIQNDEEDIASIDNTTQEKESGGGSELKTDSQISTAENIENEIKFTSTKKGRVTRGSDDKNTISDAIMQNDLPTIEEANFTSINEVKLVDNDSLSLTLTFTDQDIHISTEKGKTVTGDKNDIYAASQQDLPPIQETNASEVVVQNNQRSDGKEEINVHRITLDALKAYGFF